MLGSWRMNYPENVCGQLKNPSPFTYFGNFLYVRGSHVVRDERHPCSIKMVHYDTIRKSCVL